MIDLSEHSSLAELQNLPYWQPEEILLSALPAGDSNMNLVLRIKTNQRSLILKQSKPYVRKYPQIPAPVERIEVEYRFLDVIARDEFLKKMSAKVILFDPTEHILLMEDLGKGSEFTGIYSGEKAFGKEEVIQLVSYLNHLHALDFGDFPENMKMRQLNHEHIFHFPFLEENGLDLDRIQPGLQKISLSIKQNKDLKEKLELLGNRYLSHGKTLVHGDFYPGSWLDVPSGIKVIDPEFGFPGDREFDLGVFLAHLDLGQQAEELKETVLSAYSHSMDFDLVGQYRGVEILRRLIGIAQLPVSLSLSQKTLLLDFAQQNVLLF